MSEEEYPMLWAQKLYGVPITAEEYQELMAWYIDTYVEGKKDA